MPREPRIAIVDYGMGNLFSVKQACAHVGLDASITASAEEVRAADAVIVPGVGAFGDAMASLRELGMVEVLRNVAAEGTPFFGICLGLQLLMSESHEFGTYEGLGIVEGEVVSFGEPKEDGRTLKVPQVGWNALWRAERGSQAAAADTPASDLWADTWFRGQPDGVQMYFVHSFVVRPAASEVVVATTRYGDVEFCSALLCGNVFACQCHPERSGTHGLRVYEEFARDVRARVQD
jgi:glutamine amidotransferase